MSYLLDSDILIDFLAGNESIKEAVRGFTEDGVAISVVSYLEALQGFFKLDDDDVEESIAIFSRQLGYIAVVAVNLNVGQTCAKIRYGLARAKRRFRNRSLDLLIAATAIEYGFTLVTRNRADYHDIPGLTMVNL